MTRGKQIIEEAKRIIAEAHERGNNDPMVDLAITLSFTLGARWADKNPHWISVEDELPPDNEAFIAYWNHFVIVQQGRDERFGSNKHITHWMPLPQPPKEGGEE